MASYYYPRGVWIFVRAIALANGLIAALIAVVALFIDEVSIGVRLAAFVGVLILGGLTVRPLLIDVRVRDHEVVVVNPLRTHRVPVADVDRLTLDRGWARRARLVRLDGSSISMWAITGRGFMGIPREYEALSVLHRMQRDIRSRT